MEAGGEATTGAMADAIEVDGADVPPTLGGEESEAAKG